MLFFVLKSYFSYVLSVYFLTFNAFFADISHNEPVISNEHKDSSRPTTQFQKDDNYNITQLFNCTCMHAHVRGGGLLYKIILTDEMQC